MVCRVLNWPTLKPNPGASSNSMAASWRIMGLVALVAMLGSNITSNLTPSMILPATLISVRRTLKPFSLYSPRRL